MKISIPWLQFDLNFFLNRILICYFCSQIFDLFHPLKETIINVYTLTSSRLVHCTKLEFRPLGLTVSILPIANTPALNAVYCYSRSALSCQRRAISQPLPLIIRTLRHSSTVTQ